MGRVKQTSYSRELDDDTGEAKLRGGGHGAKNRHWQGCAQVILGGVRQVVQILCTSLLMLDLDYR